MPTWGYAHNSRSKSKSSTRKSSTEEERLIQPPSATNIDPHSLSPGDVAQLQRTIGNQAVQRLIQARRAPSENSGLAIQRTIEEDDTSDKKLYYSSLDPTSKFESRQEAVAHEERVTRERLFSSPSKSGSGEDFTFKSGDLIYGTTEDRERTATGYFGSGIEHAFTTEPVVVDNMNDLFVGTSANLEYGEVNKGTPGDKYLSKSHKMVQEFQEWFEGLAVKRKRKPVDTSATEKASRDRIRRACKLGILYTVKNQRTIRFVVDSIYNKESQARAASKSAYPELATDSVTGEKFKKKAYTDAELRYLRRNWSDPDFNKNVKFYAKGKEVAPPWEAFPEEWSKYEPKQERLLKELESLSSMIRAQAMEVALRSEQISRIEEQVEKVKAQTEETQIESTSGCFLTTACVEYKGLPDDCEELEVLRAFRDGYMMGLAEGKAMIQEYYAIAPTIVRRIWEDEEYALILEEMYQVVRTCVRFIQRGDHAAALNEYVQKVLDLKARYLPQGS